MKKFFNGLKDLLGKTKKDKCAKTLLSCIKIAVFFCVSVYNVA